MKMASPTPVPAEPAIRRTAYLLWEQAGRPAGRDLEFWLQARERLRHRVPAHNRWPWARPAALMARNAQQAGQECR